MHVFSLFYSPNVFHSACKKTALLTFACFRRRFSRHVPGSVVCSGAISCASHCQNWFLYHSRPLNQLAVKLALPKSKSPRSDSYSALNRPRTYVITVRIHRDDALCDFKFQPSAAVITPMKCYSVRPIMREK